MTTPVIRLATSADSDAILGIYAPYIDTSITFEEEAPTREAFQARTDGVLAAHPYLVAELDGKVVGYAYA
ncbi:GNAT family N-acetyltransferase, partial [Senegalimassilia anaerobia]